jgi:predicted RNA-binding Zn-ribbon protein involved in translation (DUF1610 family)
METSYYKNTKYPYLSVLRNTGRRGEYLAYKKLESFEKSGAKFLFNVYIPKTNGKTTEIDMLMICPKGIIVFESKNYSGWIFGSQNKENWYQTLPAGRRCHKEVFYNPIMQNESHVKHLGKFISEPIPFYSVVVFSDKCSFQNVLVNSLDVNIIHLSQLYLTVFNIYTQNGNTAVLDEQHIMSLYQKLYPCSQVSDAQKEQHIKEIQANKQTEYTYKENNSAINNNHYISSTGTQNLKCPKCGASLVLRTSKKGTNAGNQFYGCSNYPKCKYAKSIN